MPKMVDLDWKSKMVSSDMPPKSPKLSISDKPMSAPHHLSSLPNLHMPAFRSADISAASSPLCSAYDHYLQLPHLRKLWSSIEFPSWNNEKVLKPALHALEITFLFVSTVFSDPRPYINLREWTRRLDSLATAQVQIIATLCEDEEENPETRGAAPTAEVNDVSQSRSYSEASLLPRLVTWYKSKDVAQRILSSVEREMGRCSYTLGLGEANIGGKPILRYDAVCKPNEVHSLIKTTPYDHVGNHENHTLHATHQIAESWVFSSRRLLERITQAIDGKAFDRAARDCYAVERIWKLLAEIEDLHLLMDPDDLLRLKKQLSIRSCGDETAAFCFRSKELVEVTKLCRNLKHRVPEILEVEVDPKGGPRMQEAAMKQYMVAKSGSGKEFERTQLLQAMQGIESAMKRFFYAYKQVLTVVMGSSEANGNRFDSGDSLSQIFLEPTYFPSLDAAKTFLGYYYYYWDNVNAVAGPAW